MNDTRIKIEIYIRGDGAVAIVDVVLNDKSGTPLPDLRADRRIEVHDDHITPLRQALLLLVSPCLLIDVEPFLGDPKVRLPAFERALLHESP